MIEPLRHHARRVEAMLSPAQRALLRQREAEHLAIDAPSWTALRGVPFDLVLLRDAHRAIAARPTQRVDRRNGGAQPVRRAGPDGRWAVSAPRVGKLRSQPQSFRVGDHVEPAWDHNTLTRRLAALLNATYAAVAGDPIGQIASFVWTLARAQPFVGSNERTALVLAARLLSATDLPVLHVAAVEQDPAFTSALIAPTPEPLAAFLTRVLWDEALALAEWLAIPAPSDAARWTLTDEHAALGAARARVPSVEPAVLAALVDRAVAVITPFLEEYAGATVGAAVRTPLPTFADRLRVSVDSARRGRYLCPHLPLHDVRWSLHAGGLDAVLIAGTAGRGLAGASAIHFALEPPALPHHAGRPAPALLVIPDEATADQQRRLAAWTTFAVRDALFDGPPRE